MGWLIEFDHHHFIAKVFSVILSEKPDSTRLYESFSPGGNGIFWFLLQTKILPPNFFEQQL